MDKRGEKKLVIMQVILVVLGIAAVVYYSLIVSIVGFRRDFSLYTEWENSNMLVHQRY